jgi:hypothetical protein
VDAARHCASSEKIFRGERGKGEGKLESWDFKNSKMVRKIMVRGSRLNLKAQMALRAGTVLCHEGQRGDEDGDLERPSRSVMVLSLRSSAKPVILKHIQGFSRCKTRVNTILRRI